MSKRNILFLDSLVAVFICWSIAKLFNQADQEAFWIMTGFLGILCLFILLPKALRKIEPQKPYLGGLKFAVRLSPLLIFLSYPPLGLGLSDLFYPYLLLANQQLWLINSLINLFIFFLFGTVFTKTLKDKKASWLKVIFSSLLIFSFYLFTSYVIYLGQGKI